MLLSAAVMTPPKSKRPPHARERTAMHGGEPIYSGPERRMAPRRAVDQRSWHFDKKLSLDTLIAIVGVAVVIGGPLILAWRSMEARVQKLEIILEEQTRQDNRREVVTSEQRGLIAAQFKDLNDNMQKLQVAVGKLETQIQAFAVSTVRR